MRISLNLATRPFADLGPAIKRLRIAMAVLAVLSIGLAIGLHLVHHSAELARARDHSLDGAIARVNGERQGYINLMHQPPNAELLTHADALNQLFDEKAFSWTLAMEDLETVLPGGVQVSSIEPIRGKAGDITLHLRVIGPRDREVELVQNLEHSKRFLSPRIVGENADAAEGQGGANHPLEPVSASNRFNFDLLAEYNPASPGELEAAKKAKAAAESGAGETRPSRTTGQYVPPAARLNQPSRQGLRPGRVPYGQARPNAPARPNPNGPPVHPAQPGGPQ
jgi:type IV pilus assembly protein PilN